MGILISASSSHVFLPVSMQQRREILGLAGKVRAEQADSAEAGGAS